MSRRISWPSLLELHVFCAGDPSEERVREWVAVVGVPWAERADEHIDWLLGGPIDLAALGFAMKTRLRSQRAARELVEALRTALRAAIASPPPRVPPPRPERFARAEGGAGGMKIRGRRYLPQERHPRADFLARLHAHFGAPHVVQWEGFSYHLVDRDTGLAFEAYTGSSGPAYGGEAAGEPIFSAMRRFAPTLDAFDRLLDETAPVNVRCAFEDQWELSCVDGVLRDRDLRPEESL